MVVAFGVECHRLIAILRTTSWPDTPPAERFQGEAAPVK